MPKISVIIPIYNQSQYLDECVKSVLASDMDDYEIIIVNDGSTNDFDKSFLADAHWPKTRIFHKKNGGLVSARNFGISKAKGIYILPLDADDKISPDFLRRASNVLDNYKKIGIVGGKTRLFGDKNEIFDLPKFAFKRILYCNMLVCTCLFRRQDWKSFGGYNTNMKYGLEDWDFWLTLIEHNRCVCQFEDVVFYYRKHGSSMISNLQDCYERQTLMRKQIVLNHINLYKFYPEIYKSLLGQNDVSPNVLKRPNCIYKYIKRFIMKMYYKKYSKYLYGE